MTNQVVKINNILTNNSNILLEYSHLAVPHTQQTYLTGAFGIIALPNINDIAYSQSILGNDMNGIISNRNTILTKKTIINQTINTGEVAISPSDDVALFIHKDKLSYAVTGISELLGDLLNSNNITKVESDIITAVLAIQKQINTIVSTFNEHTHTGNGVPPTQQITSNPIDETNLNKDLSFINNNKMFLNKSGDNL